MNKAVVSLSGGLDSAVCLSWAVDHYGKDNVYAVGFNYGQKHDLEINQAKEIARYYEVPFKVFDVCSIFEESNASLMKNSTLELKKESYEKQIKESDTGIVNSYIPFRNGIFLSIITSYALQKSADVVVLGAHAEDSVKDSSKISAAYPDTSQEFMNYMSDAISSGSGRQVTCISPLLVLNKSQVLSLGLKGDIEGIERKPFPYWLTWSCYTPEFRNGKYYPCNTCATCLDREKAFKDNNIIDIMKYMGL